MNRDIQAWEHIRKYYENWYRLDAIYDRWAQRYGLRRNSMFVLFFIWQRQRACTGKELAQWMVLPKQTVSSLVQGLEEQGLIRRSAHPDDHRNKLIALTAEGKRRGDEIFHALDQAELRAYQSMTPMEQRVLTDSLTRLTDSLEASFSQ